MDLEQHMREEHWPMVSEEQKAEAVRMHQLHCEPYAHRPVLSKASIYAFTAVGLMISAPCSCEHPECHWAINAGPNDCFPTRWEELNHNQHGWVKKTTT